MTDIVYYLDKKRPVVSKIVLQTIIMSNISTYWWQNILVSLCLMAWWTFFLFSWIRRRLGLELVAQVQQSIMISLNLALSTQRSRSSFNNAQRSYHKKNAEQCNKFQRRSHLSSSSSNKLNSKRKQKNHDNATPPPTTTITTRSNHRIDRSIDYHYESIGTTRGGSLGSWVSFCYTLSLVVCICPLHTFACVYFFVFLFLLLDDDFC